MSTFALVFGGIAVVASVLPVVWVAGLFVGLTAVALGVLGMILERRRPRAIAGALLGGLAIPAAMLLAPGGQLFGNDPDTARAEVAQVQELLDRDEYAQDDCLDVTFDQGDGWTADYTVANTCKRATAAGLFIVDAIDEHGHVIGSGWGEVQSLDASGPASEYVSYVDFDADVTRAASFDVRDIDVSNAIYNAWLNGEDLTIEA